jgi:hypothetical protein
MAQAKKPRETLWTPAGRFSYPYLATPNTGGKYPDGAYKTDLLIPKPLFKEKGAALQAAVLKVGKEYFGDKFNFKGPWRHPFKDTDEDDKTESDAMKNCILIRAKSGPQKDGTGRIIKPARQPMFIGPRMNAEKKFDPLTAEEIQNIKGGDWGLLNVTVYPYDQQGGGVTFGLNAVQFWKVGEGFGQGRSKLLETAEELEAEIEDAGEVGNPAETAVENESVI